MSECLIYQLKPGKTMVRENLPSLRLYSVNFFQVGGVGGEGAAIIRLSGGNILEEHCSFDNADGKVTLTCTPDSATVCFPTTIDRDGLTNTFFSLVLERKADHS